jgi:hypothetical protein
MVLEAGMPSTHRPMNTLHKELPGLLLIALCHHVLDIFIKAKYTALHCFLEGVEHMESHGDRSGLYGGWSSMHGV